MKKLSFSDMLCCEMKRYARVSKENKSLLRPFICAGNPLKCEVIIVGINPATPIKGIFAKCWCKEKGEFDRKKFDTLYSKNKGVKGPKKTTTRYKIAEVISYLNKKCPKISILETNLWPIPTRRRKDINSRHECAGAGCLRLLLSRNSVKKLIVTLGREPARCFELCSPRLILKCPHPTDPKGGWDSKKIAKKIIRRLG